jgi:hypothetical protein
MTDFTIEEIYKSIKTKDEKLPFRTWLQKKKKKKKIIKKKEDNSDKSKDGHIDIYA